MLTIEEQERAAYMAGDTDAAALLARLDDMHHALGQSVAALEAVAHSPMTAKQARGAAEEGLIMVKRAST
jgi:hypothetical protein